MTLGPGRGAPRAPLMTESICGSSVQLVPLPPCECQAKRWLPVGSPLGRLPISLWPPYRTSSPGQPAATPNTQIWSGHPCPAQNPLVAPPGSEGNSPWPEGSVGPPLPWGVIAPLPCLPPSSSLSSGPMALPKPSMTSLPRPDSPATGSLRPTCWCFWITVIVPLGSATSEGSQ